MRGASPQILRLNHPPFADEGQADLLPPALHDPIPRPVRNGHGTSSLLGGGGFLVHLPLHLPRRPLLALELLQPDQAGPVHRAVALLAGVADGLHRHAAALPPPEAQDLHEPLAPAVTRQPPPAFGTLRLCHQTHPPRPWVFRSVVHSTPACFISFLCCSWLVT